VTPPLPIIRLLSVIALIISLVGCGLAPSANSGIEGTITYDVTFPYEKNTVMLDLFPKEMTFHFQGDKMHSEIKSSYDLLTTDFIIDNREKTITQMLKNMSDRYSLHLEGDEVNEWLKQYPKVSFEQTNETEDIAGYVCSKTIAHFSGDSIAPIVLYHTKGLGIDPNNWWNQYAGVDGFLLGYEMQQYGKRMKLRAREVKFEAVDPSVFETKPNFITIGMQDMDRQLALVVSEFMN
jgi:hypothetical protein